MTFIIVVDYYNNNNYCTMCIVTVHAIHILREFNRRFYTFIKIYILDDSRVFVPFNRSNTPINSKLMIYATISQMSYGI